jgi:polysaccharide biosynthesis protein PslG
MRRLGIAAAGAAAALALVVLAPSAASATNTTAAATPRANTTAADARVLGLTPATALHYFEYQLMGEGNVKNLRLPIFWEDLEPQRDGGYRFGALDQQIIFAAVYGIRLQPFVMGVPSWLGQREDRFYPPINSGEYISKWRKLLDALATRYGPHGDLWRYVHAQAPQIKQQPITTWQIWNEPNAWTYWHPRPTAAKDYATLLRLSARVLRSHDPNATIVVAGLFENPSDGTTMQSFLTHLYKVRGIERSFDAIDIHPYSTNVSGVVRQIREARGVLRQSDDTDTQLWISELGWPTQTTSGTGVLTKSEAEQARLLTQAFGLILRNRDKWNIGRLDWYTWRDNPVYTTCDLCAWSGLFTEDLRAKPSWSAFVRLTGGSSKIPQRRTLAPRPPLPPNDLPAR